MLEPHESYAGLRFTYLLADHYRFPGSWTYPESIVPYSLLRLIVKGEADFDLDGVTLHVTAGDVVHIPEGTRLACRATSSEIAFDSIRFVSSVKLGDRDFLTDYYGVGSVTAFGDDRGVRELFGTIRAAAQSDSPARTFTIRGSLELLVARLVEASGRRGRPDSKRLLELASTPGAAPPLRRDPRIETVVDYLSHHPTAPLDTEQLSRMAELSPSALRRLFKRHTGKTMGEFMTELRMMTAARMLLITSDRVGEIGQRCGYADQNYFARIFKGVFGLSPQAYRMVSREQQ